MSAKTFPLLDAAKEKALKILGTRQISYLRLVPVLPWLLNLIVVAVGVQLLSSFAVLR
jgi:hypothetical protein